MKKYSPRLKNTGFSAVENINVTGYFRSKHRFCGNKIGCGGIGESEFLKNSLRITTLDRFVEFSAQNDIDLYFYSLVNAFPYTETFEDKGRMIMCNHAMMENKKMKS